MTDRLVFAHPAHIRRQARDALEQHGSLRKAAAAVGIPKSTVHHWAQNGGFENLDDAPDVVNEAGGTDPAEPIEPTGYPETPTDGAEEIHDDPPEEWEQEPTTNIGMILPNATEAWTADDPKALKALLRYSNSLISGADPDHALRAAQVIDPAFAPSLEQHTRLLNSLSKIMMAEPELLLMGSLNPPPYVRDTYDKFAWDDSDIADLSAELKSIYVDAYRETINDQLSALGRKPIDEITDTDLLQKLSDRADEMALSISETWNRDLAGSVGQAWLDLASTHGRQMSQIKLESEIQGWVDDRADWKATLWGNDAAGTSNAQALQMWQDKNDTIQSVVFVGDDTECSECSGMLEDYSEPTPIDECPEFGSLPHDGCIHDWDVAEHASVEDDQELWDGTA